jgi:hypothetical protein
MTLSRDKYVPNSLENIEKLTRKILESMDFDTMRESAYQGLINHYTDNDQCFVEDYYKTFSDEDPELNGFQEEEADKIIYYHGHHSNPCVVGEIHKHETVKMSDGSMHKGIEVIIITHDIICEDYDDNLSDITKVWDSQTQSEVCNRRYDTDPDTCVHIPLNIGEHTNLSNQVLKQILLNNNVEFVSFGRKDDLTSLSNFLKNNLGA